MLKEFFSSKPNVEYLQKEIIGRKSEKFEGKIDLFSIYGFQ